jgi:hypothetical protein
MIFRQFSRPTPNNTPNSKNYIVQHLEHFLHSTYHISFVKNIMILKFIFKYRI